MEVAEHIAMLQRDGELLAVAAERAGLEAAVPPCRPWRIADLLRHLGYVHRWAAGYIIEQRAHRLPDRPAEAELLSSGPPDADLLAWYRAGHAQLVGALTAADPGLVCWYFLEAPSPRAFWARRQAHETAMHRVDAELAAGPELTPISADLAHDGIDELIMGFFGQDGKHLTAEQRSGSGPTLQVATSDTGGTWHLALTADGQRAIAVRRGTAESDCTLTGQAAGLYLLLWNRADPATAHVEVHGDHDVLTGWQQSMRITWQ